MTSAGSARELVRARGSSSASRLIRTVSGEAEQRPTQHVPCAATQTHKHHTLRGTKRGRRVFEGEGLGMGRNVAEKWVMNERWGWREVGEKSGEARGVRGTCGWDGCSHQIWCGVWDSGSVWEWYIAPIKPYACEPT